MTSRASSNLSLKTLEIKEDDKFFSRLLSKEVSVGNSSFEVYHGEAVAVPFTWESQPGTPKFKFPETPLPPLTPPPSYYSTTLKNSMKRHSKPRFFNTIFPRLTSRKKRLPTSPASSTSSSSSSSSSSPPTTPSKFHARGRASSRRRSFDSGADEEDYEYELPASPLCFGVCRRMNSRSGGCYSTTMKIFPRGFP